MRTIIVILSLLGFVSCSAISGGVDLVSPKKIEDCVDVCGAGNVKMAKHSPLHTECQCE